MLVEICLIAGGTLLSVCIMYRDARKSSTSFQTVQIRAQILTNQLLCVTVTATNKQHKFARAFEPIGNWWKTYAHPCKLTVSMFMNKICLIV